MRFRFLFWRGTELEARNGTTLRSCANAAIFFLVTGGACLSCDEESNCDIKCTAPPPTCHYEGQLTSGKCSEVTCGRVVCPEQGDGG